MVSPAVIMDVLRQIPDPEMPISIVDLGLIENVRQQPTEEGERVEIDVLPTFVGCPALRMIEDEIRTKVLAVEGVGEVAVRFLYDPAWSVDRITDAGRESLREHGVTVPERCGNRGAAPADELVPLRTSAIPCPFCASTSTRLDSPFGPTRCRMIYYCESCRNSFEHLKRL